MSAVRGLAFGRIEKGAVVDQVAAGDRVGPSGDPVTSSKHDRAAKARGTKVPKVRAGGC
ncbi:hypothetical protein [Kitasatospora sp. NPDC002965]|uniref:hypothetical protein n=1 Tax=Kitasatospora sp. NPDC002965 TaxID=3154775 RepID=UPI0033A467D6